MAFYQHDWHNGTIMVMAVYCWQDNGTIYCIHFDSGLYIELRQAAFDFFILAYHEVKLTRERYKELFCKNK